MLPYIKMLLIISTQWGFTGFKFCIKRALVSDWEKKPKAAESEYVLEEKQSDHTSTKSHAQIYCISLHNYGSVRATVMAVVSFEKRTPWRFSECGVIQLGRIMQYRSGMKLKYVVYLIPFKVYLLNIWLIEQNLWKWGLGVRRGKASFPALCSDMAFLTCFSWSHCSRTVRKNMTERTMHGRERWAITDTQTHTHIQTKTLKVQRPSHTCVWSKACWQSVCLSQYLGHMLHFRLLPGHSSFSCRPLLPINLSILFFSPSLFFPFLSETRDTPSIFIVLPCPANAIRAKNRKNRQKDRKKWNYWFDVSSNWSEESRRAARRDREEREERDWKWAVHTGEANGGVETYKRRLLV